MVWTMKDAGSLRGKTFLVTGSNAGIGFSTVRQLAEQHARVVMACRNPQKGQDALQRLRAAVPDADASLMTLDLASLASVRAFAAEFLAQHERLDVLINNAGVMMPPAGRTVDNFETQFGTNVLGHFVLTGLLLPLLNKTPGARVVTMSSVAHWLGRIDFDNLNAEQGYGAWKAYAQSKLANLMFAYELQRRLQRSAATTISIGAHPGGTNSDLGRHQLLLRLVSPLAQSTDQGALPSLRAAVDPAARGGEYYGPGGLGTFTGPAVRQRSSRYSHDESVAARLWQACEELGGMRYLS